MKDLFCCLLLIDKARAKDNNLKLRNLILTTPPFQGSGTLLDRNTVFLNIYYRTTM